MRSPASRSIASASGRQSRDRSPHRVSWSRPNASSARSIPSRSSARTIVAPRAATRLAVRRTSRRAFWLRPAIQASKLPALIESAWPGMRNSHSSRAPAAPGQARARPRGQAASASTRSRLTTAGRGSDRPRVWATSVQTAGSWPGAARMPALCGSDGVPKSRSAGRPRGPPCSRKGASPTSRPPWRTATTRGRAPAGARCRHQAINRSGDEPGRAQETASSSHSRATPSRLRGSSSRSAVRMSAHPSRAAGSKETARPGVGGGAPG